MFPLMCANLFVNLRPEPISYQTNICKDKYLNISIFVILQNWYSSYLKLVLWDNFNISSKIVILIVVLILVLIACLRQRLWQCKAVRLQGEMGLNRIILVWLGEARGRERFRVSGKVFFDIIWVWLGKPRDAKSDIFCANCGLVQPQIDPKNSILSWIWMVVQFYAFCQKNVCCASFGYFLQVWFGGSGRVAWGLEGSTVGSRRHSVQHETLS